MNLGITFQLLICILIEIALYDILQKIPEYSCKNPNFDPLMNWKIPMFRSFSKLIKDVHSMIAPITNSHFKYLFTFSNYEIIQTNDSKTNSLIIDQKKFRGFGIEDCDSRI